MLNSIYISLGLLLSAIALHADTNTFPTTGNAGAGTISPGYQLTVKGSYSSPQTLISNDGSNGIFFQAQGTSTHFNWLIGQQRTVNSAIEFAPSTAVGGITFSAPVMVILANGNIGIGTTNPTFPLAVNGTIHAKEVIVDNSGWSDYVFDPNYKLMPLDEVERRIKEQRHLPGIPSAKDVAKQGVSIGALQAKLLAKIEELTLHQIEQEKQLKAQVQQLTARLSEQSTRLERLEAENAALLRDTRH